MLVIKSTYLVSPTFVVFEINCKDNIKIAKKRFKDGFWMNITVAFT